MNLLKGRATNVVASRFFAVVIPRNLSLFSRHQDPVPSIEAARGD